MAKKKTLLPTFLNYAKSLVPSDALFYYKDPAGDWKPVTLREQTVRGSIGSHGNVYKKSGEADSLENVAKQLNPEAANIQTIDVCTLPADADTFKIEYTLAVRADSIDPSGCNDIDYKAKLNKLAEAYNAKGGYRFLAERIAWNVVNAKWFWRNRYAVNKSVTVTPVRGEGEPLVFNCDNYDIRTYPGADDAPDGLQEIADKIAIALADPAQPAFFKVEGVGTLAHGQELYPSQDFIGDGSGGRQKKGSKSRQLAHHKLANGERQAAFHSQKIGNALKQIDEFHSKVGEYGAVALEPFGYVQSRSTAIRLPKDENAGGPDFYAVMSDIEKLIDGVEAAANVDEIPADAHYAVGVLVRGGVFSMSVG